MSFIPNAVGTAVNAASFAPQAEPDSVDFSALTAAYGSTAVQSGCAVSYGGSALQTAVAAGVVRVSGWRTVVAGGTVTHSTAHATNPRHDLIVAAQSTGTVSIVAGTPAVDPPLPNIPASSILLASVYVPATATTLASGNYVDKRIFMLDPGVENVLWYGVTGNGSTDDASAFANVNTAAVASANPVWFPAATYKILSTVTWSGGVKLQGAGMEAVTIDGTGIANNLPFFKWAGALTGTTSNLSANVSPEALTATVVSGTGFAAGDYVRIESTASTGTDGILAGEILRIYSIATNVLTFDSFVQGTYTTAATGKVTKLTMLDSAVVEGLGFLGTSNAATKQQTAMEFDFVRGALVRRCRVQHCHQFGVELWNCLNARIEDNDFFHCADPNWGYAINNDGATADTVAIGNTFRNCKAAVEHTGSTGTGNGGVPRRCVFAYNTITGAYRGAMQAHTGAEDLAFIGNTVASTTSNEISGGQVDGMNVWGTRQTIIGNVFTGMFRRCIYTGNGTTSAPFRILIQGNSCRGASIGVNYGSGIEIDVSNASGGTVEAVSILGNQLKMDTAQNSNGSIRIIGLASGTWAGWIISNNDMISAPQFPAIIANNLSDFTISGNHLVVPGTGSNGVGIQIDGSADGVICGNVIVGPGSGTGVGVQAANTSGVAVTGNRIRGFFNGVKTTGTSTGWSVAANVLTGFVVGGAETSLIGTNTVTGANV